MGFRKLSFMSLFALMMAGSNPYKMTNPSAGLNSMGGLKSWAGSPIYYPKRTKLKGWQKENRRSSFNKKRRAA